MLNWMKKHLNYGNVVATLALFAVIAGGTALALPGKHRVTADDLHKNSVKAPAIATNAVGAPEIKNGSVGSADVADNSIGGGKVADQSLSYGDLGSNSVIARIHSSGPVTTTGQNVESNVPLNNPTWTQAGNEIDVIFGQVRFTQLGACGNNGSMRVELSVDGQDFDGDFFESAPGVTDTEPSFVSRPFLFEPGAPTPHTASVKIEDDCQNNGEDLRLDQVDINVVAIR